MSEKNTDTNEVKDKATLKAEKKAIRAENRAIRKLRRLLLRVWFFKNALTLIVMFVVILMACTVTGLIPESLPILGTYSYAMRDSLQTFLEIGDDEFYSTFGSITGVFTLLWSIGYASSKMKRVSYYMIDRNKILKVIMQNSNLSLDKKGRIINIEKRIGVDLDGDNFIGDEAMKDNNDPDNLVHELVQTFSELTTIINVDKETLKKTLEETDPNFKRAEDIIKEDSIEEEVEEPVVEEEPVIEPSLPDVAEAIIRKPAIPIKRRR